MLPFGVRGVEMRRAVVLGVSGLNRDLVDRWIDKLPVLKKMREDGAWGRIVSTVPPSSSPAWASSLSGRNPGAFGVWGELCRSDHSYTLQKKVESGIIDGRIRPLYRILSKLGQRVGAVNLPWTHPVPEIPGGFCIGGGEAGGRDEPDIWPREFAGEIKKVVGKYIHEVPLSADRRSVIDKNSMLGDLRSMDEQRFSLVKYLVEERLWFLICTCGMLTTIIDFMIRDQRSRKPFSSTTDLSMNGWVKSGAHSTTIPCSVCTVFRLCSGLTGYLI